MNENEYWTMREIGVLFGETSHSIGKKLKELGLRTRDGKPSGKAFRGGYCSQRWTDLNENYCWAWHRDKTVAALVDSGMTLLAEEQADPASRDDPHAPTQGGPVTPTVVA